MTTSELIGRFFALYAIIYPIIYFGYNYMAETLGFSQYMIPGFWFGMLGFILFNIAKSQLKSLFKN